MDDDATRRSRRNDDPGATGPLWPLPDDDLTDPGAEPSRREGRAAAPREVAPDREPTIVLPQTATSVHGADPTRIAPDDAAAADRGDEAPREWPAPRRLRAGRPRRVRSGPTWPRIVAPIVLLAAVLAVVTLSVHAGVLGRSKTPAGHPTAVASHTAKAKSKSKYMLYRVRAGDTMSGIAGKFNITVGRLMALNPQASSTTIVVGEKLKVPRRR